jgi:hypothetical protein
MVSCYRVAEQKRVNDLVNVLERLEMDDAPKSSGVANCAVNGPLA